MTKSKPPSLRLTPKGRPSSVATREEFVGEHVRRKGANPKRKDQNGSDHNSSSLNVPNSVPPFFLPSYLKYIEHFFEQYTQLFRNLYSFCGVGYPFKDLFFPFPDTVREKESRATLEAVVQLKSELMIMMNAMEALLKSSDQTDSEKYREFRELKKKWMESE